MPKTVFPIPGTSKTTEYTRRSPSLENNDNEFGPDTEFVSTCKNIFPSNKRIYSSSSASHCPENQELVPFNPFQRFKEDEITKNGIPVAEVISASILELFFSTLPESEQEKIRTMFIDVLYIAGVTTRNVFSKHYESTRFKLARMMHHQILQRLLAYRMSNPKIDDSLTMEISTAVAQHFTRYNEDFKEIKVIGNGGFGKVYQCQSKVDGQFYAVKKIPLKKSTGKAYQKMLDECRYHASLQHPNIVRYHNAWVDMSYKADSRPMSPEPVCKIQSISTSNSNLRSKRSLDDLDIETAKDDFRSGNASDDESSLSSSSEESKQKGFWAKKQGSANGSSFSSFKTNEDDEEVNDEDDSDDESSISDISLESNYAKEIGNNLAINDYNDLRSHMNLSTDVSGWGYIGYPTLFIQMELCHSTLEKYIHHREKHLLPIDISFNETVVESLLSAVDFLHRHSVVHRDIKPSNIFLKKITPDQPPVVKLGDFGLARSIVEELALGDSVLPPLVTEDGSNKLTKGLGTYLYASPEQFYSREYSLSADVYSSGVVIYELHHDFKTGTERVITLEELRKTLTLSPEFQKSYPQLCPLLSVMITKEPSKRLSAGELLKKFQEMRKTNCEQTELQRLTFENQRLLAEIQTNQAELNRRDAEIDLWKRKYLELARKIRPHHGHGDHHDHNIGDAHTHSDSYIHTDHHDNEEHLHTS